MQAVLGTNFVVAALRYPKLNQPKMGSDSCIEGQKLGLQGLHLQKLLFEGHGASVLKLAR